MVTQNPLTLKVVEGNEDHLVIFYIIIGGFLYTHVDSNPIHIMQVQLLNDRDSEH